MFKLRFVSLGVSLVAVKARRINAHAMRFATQWADSYFRSLRLLHHASRTIHKLAAFLSFSAMRLLDKLEPWFCIVPSDGRS